MRQTIVLGIFVLVIIISSFLIHFTYKIYGSGKILPSQEWIIRNSDGGDILMILKDHRKGAISEFKNFKFERGDIAQILFKEPYPGVSYTYAGDTLGYINSFLLDERIALIKNRIKEEQAYLMTLNSGEKKSKIQEARNSYYLAKQEFTLQKKNFERQKELFENGIIPKASYEIADNDYHLAKTNVDIEKSKLLSIQSGEKPELINYSQSKISSLENEIELLQEKKSRYSIIAPISGKVLTKRNALSNIQSELYPIMHIIDTTEYVISIPIEPFQRAYINENVKINVKVPERSEIIKANIIGEDNNIELTGDLKQIYIVRGALQDPNTQIPYGVYTECIIECSRISLFEFVLRKLHI